MKMIESIKDSLMISLNKKDNFLGCCAQTSLRFRYLTDTSEMAISDVFHSKGFGALTAK